MEIEIAATCSHSLGTVWSSHLRPLAVTHLELSGAAACGPCLEFCGTCGHLLQRPLAATCGHSLLPLAATHSELSGAATCGHLRPLAVTHLELSGAAACGPCLEFCGTCGHLLQRPLAATCGHSLRPLAATHSELSGAATCGHLRPLTWNQGTASRQVPAGF